MRYKDTKYENDIDPMLLDAFNTCSLERLIDLDGFVLAILKKPDDGPSKELLLGSQKK